LKALRNVKSITWIRSNKKPMTYRTQTKNGQLFIHQITDEEVGSYTCIVITRDGHTIRKQIHLRLKSRKKDTRDMKPSVKIVPISSDIRQGGRIELECKTGNFDSKYLF
jgi:hypothetical protein